jgi:hypothetical protein
MNCVLDGKQPPFLSGATEVSVEFHLGKLYVIVSGRRDV